MQFLRYSTVRLVGNLRYCREGEVALSLSLYSRRSLSLSLESREREERERT